MTSLANSNTEALLQVELSRARRPLLLQLSSIWWLDSDSWSAWHCTSYTKLCTKMGQRFPQRLIGVKVSECIMIYNLTSTTAFSLFHKIKKSSHEFPSDNGHIQLILHPLSDVYSASSMLYWALCLHPPTKRHFMGSSFLLKLTLCYVHMSKREKSSPRVESAGDSYCH